MRHIHALSLSFKNLKNDFLYESKDTQMFTHVITFSKKMDPAGTKSN